MSSKKIALHLQSDWPHDMSYDKANEDVARFYDTLDDGESAIRADTSMFYKRRQVDIFLLAMAIGHARKNRKKVSRPSMSIRRDALKEKEVWMMCSVALAEEGRLEVLADPPHVVRICEEYANGGINELMKMDKSVRGSEKYEDSIVRLARGAS